MAKTKLIEGTVTNEDSLALSNVNIVSLPSGTGTQSSQEGDFSFKVVNDAVKIFLCPGSILTIGVLSFIFEFSKHFTENKPDFEVSIPSFFIQSYVVLLRLLFLSPFFYAIMH